MPRWRTVPFINAVLAIWRVYLELQTEATEAEEGGARPTLRPGLERRQPQPTGRPATRWTGRCRRGRRRRCGRLRAAQATHPGVAWRPHHRDLAAPHGPRRHDGVAEELPRLPRDLDLLLQEGDAAVECRTAARRRLCHGRRLDLRLQAPLKSSFELCFESV
eukprot:scaffold3365_cov66-Phaeocystis_antarctica.AAC.10